MENKQSMVKVENLEVFYGGIQAIHGISLEIFQGEMVAIIGANGAGKSTLLKTLAGDKDYRSGTIAFQGQPLPSKSHQFVEIKKPFIRLNKRSPQIEEPRLLSYYIT